MGNGVLWGFLPCGFCQKVILWLRPLSLPLSVCDQTAFIPSCGQQRLQMGWDAEGMSHIACVCPFFFFFFQFTHRTWNILTHTAHNSVDHWIMHQSVLQEMMAESSDSPLWLTASRAHCGVVGMVNCLRQEPGGNRIRWESRLKASNK